MRRGSAPSHFPLGLMLALWPRPPNNPGESWLTAYFFRNPVPSLRFIILFIGGLTMSPLGLVFLAALMAPAQNAPQNAPKLDRESFARQSLQDLLNHPDRIAQCSSPAPTCFTMRTYFFKRPDAAAPELAGTSTCTH